MIRNQLLIVTTSLLQSWFRFRPITTGSWCCRFSLTSSTTMVHAVSNNDQHATEYQKENRIIERRRKILPVSTVPYRSQIILCKTNVVHNNKTSCCTLPEQRYLSQISTTIQNNRWNHMSLSLMNTISRKLDTIISPIVTVPNRLATKTFAVTLFPTSAPRSSSIKQQQQIRTLHDNSTTVTTVPSRHQQSPKQEEQEQFVSIWERTKSFSSNVYKIYQDYQLYKNISQTSQTAIINLFLLYQHHNQNTTSTTMHNWTQRIHRLRCNSIQHTTTTSTTKNQCLWNDTKLPVSTLSEFLLQYANDNNTSQTTKGRNLYNIIIPYRQQQQQYQLTLAVQKVLPTIIGFLIPIIGYLPMILSILFPKQLLCRHFYNPYEILHYNTLFYQQQYQYYPNVVARLIIKQQQQQPSDPIHVLQTISNQWRREESINLLLFNTENHPTTNTSHHPAQQQQQSTLFTLSPLHTLSREQLIDLSLSCNGNGIYSILPSTINLYLTKYCTPTWYLHRFLSTTIHTIIHFDLLLLCEEVLLLSCTTSTSSHTRKSSKNSIRSNQSSMSYLSTMTRIELSDACLLRGLPIGNHITNDEMIEALQQHLQIVATIILSFMTHRWHEQQQQQKGITSSSHLLISKHDIESIGLYMLYLPMIRDYLAQNNVALSTAQK